MTVPFALVHHANQYLVVDGYLDRQGISEIAAGYSEILAAHERHAVPTTLHLSGTLIEALAWQAPRLLAQVRELLDSGLVALVGGTYSENVMPCSPPAWNRRQLKEALGLITRHLGRDPSRLSVAWVPERVWEPDLAPVLADRTLPNGGYRWVLLDDRLLEPVGPRYPGSPRAAFDRKGPWASMEGGPESNPEEIVRHLRAHRIKGSHLGMVPISAHLRYWLPPSSDGDLDRVAAFSQAASASAEPDTILVFADDLERSAGVGGWCSDRRRYERLLGWLAERDDLTPVLLPDWLAGRVPSGEVDLEPGGFFELAQAWRAGEDYRGWWDAPAYAESRSHLERARASVEAAQSRRGDARLVELAAKQVLAASYETAWHDPAGPQCDGPTGTGPDPGVGWRAPAGWARALASHARAAALTAAAAGWLAGAGGGPSADVGDVDGDGDDELILANECVYAVVTPARGARVTALYAPGVSLIGNPVDDWNLLEDLHGYMAQPANHPGALAIAGHENERWAVEHLTANQDEAVVELVHVGPDSILAGARLRLRLSAGSPALQADYDLPEGTGEVVVVACLSPDYLRLLREGRDGLRRIGDGRRRGAALEDAHVRVVTVEGGEWVEPVNPEAGHGLNVAVRAVERCLRLQITTK
jgi:hypothetical protein